MLNRMAWNPCVNEEPKRNYFDIAPLLRQHENKLRREIVQLTISLPNLEQIEQVVLNKQLSSSDVRSMLPEGSVSQADEEVDEGFRTPVSVCASGYASGCSSPQSLKPKAERRAEAPSTVASPDHRSGVEEPVTGSTAGSWSFE
ncbi:hypothetical protein MRX96_004167 [Rhipicephalus microplus]